MEIGIVGLGRMGAGMARRLARGGAHVICYDRSEAARKALAGEAGIDCAENLAALCARLSGERVIVIMLPAGDAVENTVQRPAAALLLGRHAWSTAGNSYYRDSMRRAMALSQQGLRYIDAGVSGGVHGLEHGYCLMLGGTRALDRDLRALRAHPRRRPGARLAALRAERRRALREDDPQRHRVRNDAGARRGLRAARGAPGARHRRRAPRARPGATAAWCARGCSSCALESSRTNEELEGIAPVIDDSGEGRWTALESIELGMPAPVITTALMARFASQGRSDRARKLLAMMRQRFGGHAVHKNAMIVLVMGVSGSGKNADRRAARASASAGSSSTATTTTRRRTSKKMAAGTAAAGRGPLAVARPAERHAAEREGRRRRLLGPQGSVSATTH